MKFFFKFIECPHSRPWEGSSFAKHFATELKEAVHPSYSVVKKPDDADVIVLVESVQFKGQRYLKLLQNEPLLQSRPNDCFTINYDDDALGILPGLYAGLPVPKFNSARHRATGYLYPAPFPGDQILAESADVESRYLFSFRGAASHPVRNAIFARSELWQEFGPIVRMERWFNHTDEERFGYGREILESRFVLCPRGISPVTHRLFEVMQLGRVPVIQADSWVPPQGPTWDSFSIRVEESETERIPEILTERFRDAEAMGRRARVEWERWFSPERRMVVAASAIDDLRLNRPANHREEEELRKWQSVRRHWEMGWTIPQRALGKARKILQKKIAVGS